MIPVVSIIGWSNSGKTTFVTYLIPELKKRGYKIATIKHDAHKFEIDKPGKDSWRHRKAGAEQVVLTSHEKLALIKEVTEQVELDYIMEHYIDEEFDLVITEGYKTGDKPKIEIFRPAVHDQPALPEDKLLTRIINDYQQPELLAKKVAEVADLIEEKIILNDFNK
ncbi:molybdopterin-guanine dinucleotide biosynthesis protein B [Natroniella sulfidigena]|uniref:molybdopterin-guanine dinucleotide biosynthesis protein B n=1 Tax=Natroniella sulfidigena TaxID=723921 RepID=UPI00200B1F81|nr:molybdopterin-guanine dinucleotide biosynthesis protein B [Natroniella sulfidigena]MCK8816085.1 molybdopterin-guanine dinucleotide biosynthesis protein B [Natroniella sulfidigena]